MTHTFPLLSGHMSLDLVNTEVIKRGQRHDLLRADKDFIDWLTLMKETTFIINDELIDKVKLNVGEVLSATLAFRSCLRKNFEQIADEHFVSNEFIHLLEQKIENAPFVFKFISDKLTPFPIGETKDVILALIAFDALRLIESKKIQCLKRCANPDCVLLFIDESGRRKWCSMKICGNRMKVARFQKSKNHRQED